MAQRKKAIEKETEDGNSESIGGLMKHKSSSRDRNLAMKAKLIEEGLHPSEPVNFSGTQKERNLAMKAKLIEEGLHPAEPVGHFSGTQKERNLAMKAKLKGNGKTKGE